MGWVTTATFLRHLRTSNSGPVWNRLVARFRRPIVSFARRLGLPEPDAEDVAQDTLLTFSMHYRKGRYDRSRGRLSSWLFGIAFRQIHSARRKLARCELQIDRSDTTSFWSTLPDRQSGNEIEAEDWERAILQKCLDRVSREVRPATFRAFEMVVLEQRDASEAAADLHTSIKAVYNAKHRVLKRVREYCEASKRASGLL